MRNPLRYHNKNHGDLDEPFETCWRCGRDRARCRSKIRFTSWAEANEWVTEKNESAGYVNPVVRYACRWCGGWHMTTANDPRARARVERQRRKWLIRQREADPHAA